MAVCPECESAVDVDDFDVDIGDELTCAECGTLLRVASDSPVELEAADEDDEDDLKDDTDEESDDDEEDDEDEADGDETWGDRSSEE